VQRQSATAVAAPSMNNETAPNHLQPDQVSAREQHHRSLTTSAGTPAAASNTLQEDATTRNTGMAVTWLGTSSGAFVSCRHSQHLGYTSWQFHFVSSEIWS